MTYRDTPSYRLAHIHAWLHWKSWRFLQLLIFMMVITQLLLNGMLV